MKKNLKYYLNKALNQHFALGAFNICNLENFQAVLEASIIANSPVIVAISESSMQYMGEDFIKSIIQVAKKKNPALFFNLDHGKSFEICKKAIDLGFDSVMIDGSLLSLKDNIALTKKVVKYAHKRKVLVEGEIGQIKGTEDKICAKDQLYTRAIDASIFVKQTEVDLLAVSIGTAHGANKYTKKAQLRFDILSEIEKELPNTPLVLHGASTVDKSYINLMKKYGGKINGKGLDKQLIVKAVKNHNIVKVNTDTDIRLVSTASLRKILSEKPDIFDPRIIFGYYKKNLIKYLTNKIQNVLFSDNKI